jgi:hypothetical protein
MVSFCGRRLLKMERETGFEPATSTLARSHSTTELFPLTRGRRPSRERPDHCPEVAIVPQRPLANQGSDPVTETRMPNDIR